MAVGTKLEIVSPERLVLSEHVASVTVPGADGYFAVLGDHAPLMSTLKPGFITTVDGAGKSEQFYVRGGFVDVSPAGVTILAEQAIPTAEFSRAEIEASLLQAEEELASASTPEARNFLEELVYGLRNLLVEAQHLNQAHIH
ncbi:MAG: F0F1 ATP synthase subunit epsilon [Devosia sp.]|nr:F0F1 ATP synthase subunit epsilon [Devosia sp.]